MSKKRILNICPVGHDPVVEPQVKAYLQKYCRSDSEIEVRSLGEAPMDLEYYVHEALIAEKFLRQVKLAEEDGFDAAILGCFYDPYIDAAKELCTNMVVVGPGEASMRIATSLARRFSIIAPTQKTVQHMYDDVKKSGFSEHLASIRALDVPVTDLLGDPGATQRKMCVEIETALKIDRAEAIILGCTLEFGHFEELQKKYGVPVIDVSLAALKYAEFMISVRDACGWHTSKICTFTPPPPRSLY